MRKKYTIGFTSGVYDMFHIGHLNVLKRAKELCDFLIVGVSTDEVVLKNKNKNPIIPFDQRMQIVESIKYVDKVIPQTNYNLDGKKAIVLEYKVDAIFVGSDWKGTEKWKEIEKELNEIGCDVVYLPHTDGISSTDLRKKIGNQQ